MRACGAILLLYLVSAATAAAQEKFVVPPAHPRGFSHIAGQYRISVSVAPTEVKVEEPITFKVRIEGKGPAEWQPQRKKLDIFPDDLAEHFFLEDAVEFDLALPEKGLWVFGYRLRPKSEEVKQTPELRLVYYAPGPKRFQTSFADGMDIVVKRPPPPTPKELDLKVVAAPPSFFRLASVSEILGDSTMWFPGSGTLAVLALLPPVACSLGYWWWQRRHPTARQRQALTRSRAARQALEQVQKERPDPARLVALLADYLRQRFDLQTNEPTPAEVAEHLRRLGVSKATRAAWADLLAAAAASRFAPAASYCAPASSEPAPDLVAQATRLIQALEAEPCLHQ